MQKKITHTGGNQYYIEDRHIDMDGITIVSNEDFDKIETAGLDNDTFLAPKHSDGDADWEAVAEHILATNDSFNVDEYIKMMKQEELSDGANNT